MKRRRFDRAKLRPDTLDIGKANLNKVLKIQYFVRRYVVGKSMLKSIKSMLIADHHVL